MQHREIEQGTEMRETQNRNIEILEYMNTDKVPSKN